MRLDSMLSISQCCGGEQRWPHRQDSGNNGPGPDQIQRTKTPDRDSRSLSALKRASYTASPTDHFHRESIYINRKMTPSSNSVGRPGISQQRSQDSTLGISQHPSQDSLEDPALCLKRVGSFLKFMCANDDSDLIHDRDDRELRLANPLSYDDVALSRIGEPLLSNSSTVDDGGSKQGRLKSVTFFSFEGYPVTEEIPFQWPPEGGSIDGSARTEDSRAGRSAPATPVQSGRSGITGARMGCAAPVIPATPPTAPSTPDLPLATECHPPTVSHGRDGRARMSQGNINIGSDLNLH